MDENKPVSWIAPEGQRRAKSAVAVAMSFIILLSGLAFVSWKGYDAYMDWMQQEDYIGTGDEEVDIIISDGQGWGNVADTLMSVDAIKDPALFEKEALKITDGPQAGTWKVKTHIPARLAAEMLTTPANRVYVKFTVREGLRVTEVYPLLIEQFGITQEEIDTEMALILEDPSLIGVTLPINGSLEGVLFPDTYHLNPPQETENPKAIFKRMAIEFNKVLESLQFAAKAEALGYSPYQALIVASIIEKEVNKDEYRGMVAQAIYNRLETDITGHRLEIDTSVNYGLNRTGYANLDEYALKTDTPYNTYIHQGLPPTPISLPGRASLEAAVNPTPGTQAFWVAVDLLTGETKFADTYNEHLKNVAQYQAWCRANPEACK
ncbi:MAG: endolytic transglycosylase MltG [Propionibacteriaceae bacterium]|jgi:UPF0755 protein|nr:endolytic transglycosylase MltG [Propionibacteriaceae bacterium]